MDISFNAQVNCSDGPCGQSAFMILKPTTEEITHLVVSDNLFPETEYQVSIDHVVESTPHQIRLDCSRAELSKMPIFDRSGLFSTYIPGYIGNPYMTYLYYAPIFTRTILEKNHLPAGELAIGRGARVEAADGQVGQVEEFLIDPNNDHITHLVMREGYLWWQKDVTIPVSRVDHYKDNTVYLNLNKQDIEKFPDIPVRHR